MYVPVNVNEIKWETIIYNTIITFPKPNRSKNDSKEKRKNWYPRHPYAWLLSLLTWYKHIIFYIYFLYNRNNSHDFTYELIILEL
jgi:hypothetical protein